MSAPPEFWNDLQRGQREARLVLCIGGPLNGQLRVVRGNSFHMPVQASDRFESVRYEIDGFYNGGEVIYFARAQDVAQKSVIVLLLEAYAAWHGAALPRHVNRFGEGRDWEAEARSLARENAELKELTRPHSAPFRAGRLKMQEQTVPISAVQIAIRVAPLAIDPDAPCDDCKGTRRYEPFTGPAIPCPTCRPAPAQPV
jgi:hypothetical protein